MTTPSAPTLPPKLRKTNQHLFLIEGEAPGAPGLSATRCTACSAVTIARVPVCPVCFSRKVEPTVAGKTGEIVELSVTHHPAGGFAAPYVIALIRTSEQLTLFAPLDGPPASFKAGDKVRFTTVPRDDGSVGFAYALAAART